MDVALEAHRRARSGGQRGPPAAWVRLRDAEAAGARAAVGPQGEAGPTLGTPDIFGNVHAAVCTEVLECGNCGRKIMAGRFAPHLEKCFNQGRAASRSRRHTNGYGDVG